MATPEAVAEKLAIPLCSNLTWGRALGIVQRIVLTSLAVAVSILIPDFGSMMAFLGSFSAFVLCIIGPVGAKVAIEKKLGRLDAVLLMIAIVMAAWGTFSAFT